MPLKILNWNIESFGITRQVPERLRQVARVIADENADIVCIQELVVSRHTRAAQIVGSINNELQHLQPFQYNYILCPHNRFEMYLYLYRSGPGLQALTLRRNQPAVVDTDTAQTVTWVPYGGDTQIGMSRTGLDHYFPLLHYPDIGAGRPPGLGLFRYTDANNVTRDLCVMNWHNDAAPADFRRQSIGHLARTPILAAHRFSIAASTGPSVVDNIIIAGDFNDPLQPNPFAGYTVHTADNTHLHPFDRVNDGQFRTSNHVRDACYDNLVTVLNGIAVVHMEVVDLPQRLWNERNGPTAVALRNSNLLAPGTQDQLNKDRLVRSVPSERENRRNGIKKGHRTHFRHFLGRTNLRRIRTTTLRPMIDDHLGQLPENIRDILTRRTLTFIDRELTDSVRWSVRAQDMNHLLFNDALFLTRAWMSDHLPLVMTLNP